MKKLMNPLQMVILIIILGMYMLFAYMWFGPISTVPNDSQILEQVEEEMDYYYGRD